MREEIKPDDEARRIKSKKRRRRKRGEETREWIDSKGKFDSPFLLKPIDEWFSTTNALYLCGDDSIRCSQSNRRLPLAICPSRGCDNVSIRRPPICRSSPRGGRGGRGVGGFPRCDIKPRRAAIRVSRVHARNNIILAPRRIIGIRGRFALPRATTVPHPLDK